MQTTRRQFVWMFGAAAWWPPNWFRRDVRLAGIRFRKVRNGAAVRHYLWIHGNEQTARRVLEQHMRSHAGLAFLVRNDVRNVRLDDGELDPNRMFSRVGAERNLRMLNPSWSAQDLARALVRLDRGRDRFVEQILPSAGRLLVALHNNGPGYSVQDEVPISNAAALNDPVHPDEFFLCTSEDDFRALAAGGQFNALLQNSAGGEDDGSLSRLCASRGLRYVNIEAAHDNDGAQARMLQHLEAVLR